MYPKIVTIAAIGLVLMVLPPALALRYTVHNTMATYFEALTQCILKGGALAAVEIEYQQTQIWNAIKKSGGTLTAQWWISGTDLGMEGAWFWLSRNRPIGAIVGWTNWGDKQPDNTNDLEHCMRLNGLNNGKWNDANCLDSAYYVCEYAD